MAVCNVCFRHCEIKEGQTGFCMARTLNDGKIIPSNYGRLTSIALDPIEKKPLARYYPGSMILSVGSYGCNLRCPFCQNHSISFGREVASGSSRFMEVSPEQLVEIALEQKAFGNIGIAFTYNEPLVGWEYVYDTARLAHDAGLKTVLVSNGTASAEVRDALLPHIDAANIDLKSFSESFYSDFIHGSRSMTMSFIEKAAEYTHLEVTWLVVRGKNDTEEEAKEISCWLHSLEKSCGCEITLHVTRFFPTFHLTDRAATDVEAIYRLANIARQNLRHVYEGNV